MGKQGSNFSLGYDKEARYATEASDQFFNEHRWRCGFKAAAENQEPPSKALGAELRKSHITFGIRALAAPESPKSEIKRHYTPKPWGPAQLNGELKRFLKQTSVDNAYGQPKNCSDWQSAQKEALGANAQDKYGSKPPDAFDNLKAELRRSSVPMKMEGCASSPGMLSESKGAYVEQPYERAEYQSQLAEDLRRSHVDIANGAPKSASHWRGEGGKAMAQHAREKFECAKPKAFDHLSTELRKSSVPLHADFMIRGAAGGGAYGRSLSSGRI